MTGEVDAGTGEDRLSAAQRALLDVWFPDREVVADHSWGLVGTYVLEVRAGNDHLIVKAADERDGQLPRELRAHREWLGPWTATNRAPTLVRADAAQRLLVTRFLPGRLVQGDTAEQEPDVYRQAGALLAGFHAQSAVLDEDWGAAMRRSNLTKLEKPNRIDNRSVERLREDIAGWPVRAATLVPTHGDWQPRNWLIHDGTVSAIDFGRAAFRTASSDFVRLASGQFAVRPDLEQAFLAGYGSDPRKPDIWRIERLSAAIGTAVWAYAIGDDAFELEGRRAIDEILSTP